MIQERCPVCGGFLSPEGVTFEVTYEGKPFSFCSLDCMHIFQHFPQAYAEGQEPELQAIEDLSLQD
ncbi:MAG: YHS domain-containing protein [Acidobacteriota bacterium]